GAMHFDAHYAAATTWQRPLMISTVTLQRLIGMTSKTYGRRSAILGFDDIAISRRLFGGDTLHAESEGLDVDPAGQIRVLICGRTSDGGEAARITCRMAIEARTGAVEPVEEQRFGSRHGCRGAVISPHAAGVSSRRNCAVCESWILS